MMASQKIFHFPACSGSSFRQTPESSDIMHLLNAGVRRHDGKLRFPISATPSFMKTNSSRFGKKIGCHPNPVGVHSIFTLFSGRIIRQRIDVESQAGLAP
jgi:hypothetical protein